jgi:hypothetical protein
VASELLQYNFVKKEGLSTSFNFVKKGNAASPFMAGIFTSLIRQGVKAKDTKKCKNSTF